MLRLLTSLVILTGLGGPAAAFVQGYGLGPQLGAEHQRPDLRVEGALSWDTLRELDLSFESPFPGQTSYTTSFTTELKELDGTEVKLVGFLYPLEAGEAHQHFLLAAYPPSCPFCLPGGPTELVEIFGVEQVSFTDRPLVLAGRFELLEDDPTGLLYRLHEARQVR